MNSKVIATLKLITPGSNQTMVASYFDKGQAKTIAWASGDDSPRARSASEMQKIIPVMVALDDSNNWSHDIVVTDITDTIAVERAYKWITFWSKHTQVRHSLNPTNTKKSTDNSAEDIKWNNIYYNHNLSDPKLELVIVDDVRVNKIDNLSNKIKICNIVIELSTQEQREVCYYFNQKPPAQNDDLLLFLLDFNTGLLWNDDNINEFLSVYATKTNKDNSEMKRLKVIANKAINTRKADNSAIIENKSEKYYYGKEIVADGYDGLLIWLKDNKTVCDIIEKETNAIDERNAEVAKKIENATGVKRAVKARETAKIGDED